MNPQNAVPPSTRLLGRIWPFCSLLASTTLSPTSSHWATCSEPLPTGITPKILTQRPGGGGMLTCLQLRSGMRTTGTQTPLPFCFGCWVLMPREPPALGHASSRPVVFSPDHMPLRAASKHFQDKEAVNTKSSSVASKLRNCTGRPRDPGSAKSVWLQGPGVS